MEPLAGQVLSNLFAILDKPVSEENEYVMKGLFLENKCLQNLFLNKISAIMRCFSTLQEKVIPFLGATLPKLTEKLQIVAKNPSKPHFNHYLFETFSLAIRLLTLIKFVINIDNGFILELFVITILQRLHLLKIFYFQSFKESLRKTFKVNYSLQHKTSILTLFL